MTHDLYTIHPTHGTRRGRGVVVIDNPPLGLDSKKSQIKIKLPAMIKCLTE